MYQVLYRKYRPQVFSDVVGQEHITTTLSHEVATGKLSHAYLFTGSRGTGKTTCAKILAKAVNCLHPKDGNPCNECDVCRGIDSGAILDVVEIDAASNNGVDNIRDIRDESGFAPASCRCRVYIIDEVHMLSIGAFNALLKTLEEPPAHVKFILATTEVHKLPVTILSRCQRFDFHRVPPEAMKLRMDRIAAAEGFTLDDDAALLIARLADGGMRDALSTLDQCITRDRHVTAKLVAEVVGMAGRDHLFALADAAAAQDSAAALELLDRLYAASCDMERLCADLTLHYRSLMIVKTVRSASQVLVCTAEEQAHYLEQSKRFTLAAILRAIDLLQDAAANMKKGGNRRVEMEMTLLRLASPKLSTDVDALLERVAALERAVQTGGVLPTAKPVSVPQTAAVSEPQPIPEPQVIPAVPEEPQPEPQHVPETPPAPPADAVPQNEPEPERSEDRVLAAWPQVMETLAQLNRPLWGILLNSAAYVRGDFLLIQSENPTFPSFIKTGSNARDVKEAAFRVTGQKYRLGIYRPAQDAQPSMQTPAEDPLDTLLAKAQALGVNVTE